MLHGVASLTRLLALTGLGNHGEYGELSEMKASLIPWEDPLSNI